MQNNIQEFNGQQFYWEGPAGGIGLPRPVAGSVKQVGEFHICLFPDGTRWVSWADRRDCSLITRDTRGVWSSYDHTGTKHDEVPAQTVIDAVYSTLLAWPKDTTYHGHGPHQAQQELAARIQEGMLTKIVIPPTTPEIRGKNCDSLIIDDMGPFDSANPDGVLKLGFEVVPKAPNALQLDPLAAEFALRLPINTEGPEPRTDARSLHLSLGPSRSSPTGLTSGRESVISLRIKTLE